MMTATDSPNGHLTDSQRLRFRVWFQTRFSQRCQKNQSYSLRAFARSIDLEASTVSQILSGKRAPSRKALLDICEKLSASPKDLMTIGILSGPGAEMSDFYTLAADSFAVLADWYHFAILELTFVNGFKSDPRWIASELDVSVQEVKGAIDRLLRLGLLEMNGGKLMKTHESVSNHVGLKSTSAHKTLQKQVLSKALSAIDETGAEDKDITSITMAIDPKNIELAREAIKNFRRELCATLENGNQTRVYNLAIQLYPISKGNS